MYLITQDYLRIIQPPELNSITSNSPTIRQLVEGSVQREIYAYLRQQYDLDSEFTDTTVFSMTVIYKGNNRVYLDATAYSAASTYALKALTLQAGNVYVCTTAITVAEPFTIAHWTLLGQQYDLFYITLPKPLFSVDTFYYRADQVFWKDKVYTAKQDSLISDQQDTLQANDIENLVRGNVVPDDRVNGQQFWGVGVAYAVPVETLPTNVTYWTKGDNRNQMFLSLMMDMVVYELSKRIAPNNMPEARHNAWLRACSNLKNMANGNINAQLPIIQPKSGQRIRWGGKPKEENNW